MKQFLANIIPPKNEYLNCLYGFLLFLLLMPYFLWSIRNLDMYIFIFISILNIYNCKKHFSLIEIMSFVGLFLFYIYATQNRNLNGVIVPLLFLTFLVANEKFILTSFKYFRFFFALSLGLSIVFFCLYICSVNLPYEQIAPLNKIKTDTYYQFPFFIITSSIMNNILPRFFGMFDEPGVVGTFSGIVLFVGKYNFSKISNIIFLIAGVISFSIYFIVITAIGLLVFSSGSRKIIYLIVLISAFLFTKNIPEIDTLVWKRAEIEDGRLAGDNRSSSELDAYYQRFLNSSDLLLGRVNEVTDLSSASYKQMVVNYGVIFCSLFVLSFALFAYGITRKWKYTVLTIFLLLTLLYQRPFIFLPAYFFVLYIPAIVFKLERN